MVGRRYVAIETKVDYYYAGNVFIVYLEGPYKVFMVSNNHDKIEVLKKDLRKNFKRILWKSSFKFR